MTARTHDLAAITLLSIVVFSRPLGVYNLPTVIAVLFANLIGGVTPDIDQPTAPLWRNLPIGKYFGRVFDTLTGGHRFLTHSILGLTLFGYGAHWLIIAISGLMPRVDTGYVWWAFMIGMLSHLIMDTLTKEGVPWLLPFPHKFGVPPIKKLRITTGKALETFGVFPALLIFNAIWLGTHYAELVSLLHMHIVS